MSKSAFQVVGTIGAKGVAVKEYGTEGKKRAVFTLEVPSGDEANPKTNYFQTTIFLKDAAAADNLKAGDAIKVVASNLEARPYTYGDDNKPSAAMDLTSNMFFAGDQLDPAAHIEDRPGIYAKGNLTADPKTVDGTSGSFMGYSIALNIDTREGAKPAYLECSGEVTDGLSKGAFVAVKGNMYAEPGANGKAYLKMSHVTATPLVKQEKEYTASEPGMGA